MKVLSSLDVSSQRILNVASPSAATDGVNKSYVDNLVQGLAWKNAVRAATTAAGTLTTSFANASVIDGVTLATGDRILIKNQAAGAENGIYTVNATGAPTRATDADAGAELVNATVYVSNGTTNADTAWTQTVGDTTTPPTLGTTALAFSQVGGGATVTAGNGLTGTSTFSVLADPVTGGGISVTAAGVKVDTAVVVRKFSQAIGDGTTTAIAVTHSLGSQDIIATCRDATSNAMVLPDITATSTTVATFTFAVAPTASQYRVTIHS